MTAPKVPSFTEAELDDLCTRLPFLGREGEEAADAIAALRRDYASYKRDARQMEEALRTRLDESRRERVPREETEDMIIAGLNAYRECRGHHIRVKLAQIWRAMFDAAPASERDK